VGTVIYEEELDLYQLCPARLQFGRQTNKLTQDYTPITTATRWLWAQQLRTGNKSTIKLAKHKWGQVVTSWGIAQGLNTKEIRDYITKHLQAYIGYWEWYVNTPLEPIAVGIPFRLKFGDHILISVPDVLVADESNLYVLNVSDDNSNHHTITNYTYRARLWATSLLQSAPVVMLNFRFNNRLERATLRSIKLCTPQFQKNLTHTLDAIAAHNSTPILNCALRCPYKEQCFQ